MSRSVDYEARRKAVLAATINKYIKESAPVASEDIAADFGLSSATVRNIFAELEQLGLITHPYTSGGRIPTSKGYRYYTDFLISQMELLDVEKKRIAKEYEMQLAGLEGLLEMTSEVISDTTHYAGIASFLDGHDKFFYRGVSFVLENPEFNDAKRIRVLVKMLEQKESLLEILNRNFDERVKIYIGEELGLEEMDGCALVVSSYRLKKKPSGRVAVLGPMRMEYKRIIPAVEYISNVLSDTLERF